MSKVGLLLIGIAILCAVLSIVLGFKLDNMLFPFIIGFLVVIGLVFLANIFRFAKELAEAFSSKVGFLSTIKRIFLSIYNSLDIFAVIGQLVFYLLIVMKTPTIFNSIEQPKNFKTKNVAVIISFALQLIMTISRVVMRKSMISEVTLLLGVITAFLIYDIRTDIEKKKVDKYSYK